MKKIARITAIVALALIVSGCDAAPRDTEAADIAGLNNTAKSAPILTIRPGRARVDGDLSEWRGDDVQWLNLDKVYCGMPDARDVTEAKFAARWDRVSNKIYVAVVVTDNDDFRTDAFGPHGAGWDAGDRIEIISVGDAEAATGWADKHNVAQEYVVGVTKAGGAWAAWGTGDALHPETELEYAARMVGNQTIYEAAVRLFDNYGRFVGEPTVVTKLKPSQVVRFDVIVNTRHKNGFGMLALDDNAGRFDDSSKITKFMLVEG